jgi:glycogen(starch) synthase
LYFVESFWPMIGGVELVSARLLPLLARRGYEIVVVTNRESEQLPEYDAYEGIPVHRFPFLRAIRERDLELLARSRAGIGAILAEHRPELIHAVFTGPGIWLLPADSRAPTIVAFHGSWPTVDFGAADGLTTRVLGRSAWVTACSRSALDDLLAAAPPLADRASVILNGLDPGFDGEPPEPPPGPPVLLCAARIVQDKGFDVAIDALAAVRQTHPDARLLIAGDGPALGALRERAARHGLEQRVEFLGWISPTEIEALLARASIVLVPSRLEGFGLIALEAALMARPVIASDVGGLHEVVQDGVTGVLVAPEDVAAMSAAVTRLLSDPETARAVGRAGRARALERFSARRHTDEWDALYRRVARGFEGGEWVER